MGFQLVDLFEFLFAAHSKNIPIFVNLQVEMFLKLSRDKIFHYQWNKKLKLDYVWGRFVGGLQQFFGRFSQKTHPIIWSICLCVSALMHFSGLQGQDVGGTDFNTRLICITREIIEPRHNLMKTGKLDKASEPFSVRAKPFWDLTATQSVICSNVILLLLSLPW